MMLYFVLYVIVAVLLLLDFGLLRTCVIPDAFKCSHVYCYPVVYLCNSDIHEFFACVLFVPSATFLKVVNVKNTCVT